MFKILKAYKPFTLIISVFFMIAIIIFYFGPSRQILQKAHGEVSQIFQPGQVNFDWWGSPWDAVRFNPFGGTFSLPMLIFASLYMLVICLIGKEIILSFLDSQQNLPNIPLFFAGFLIGYTSVLLPIRLIFIFFPANMASVISLYGLLLWSINSAIKPIRSPTTTAFWFSCLIFLFCVVVALLHRIQAGKNFIVPDSDLVFLEFAREFKANKTLSTYLVTWDQQSDEWFFSAPGVFLFRSSRYDSIWYLLTAAFGQISLFSSIYLFSRHSLQKLSQSFSTRLSAWVPACLVFFSTPAWIPTSYISLFGGGNPVAYLGHPGRYVGLILPCILVFLVQQRNTKVEKSYLHEILFFAGIGFMSIHLGVYFVLIGVVLLFIKNMGFKHKSAHDSPKGSLIIFYNNEKIIFIPALFGLVIVYVLNNRDLSPGETSVLNLFSRSSSLLLIGSFVSILLFKAAARESSQKHEFKVCLKRFTIYGLALSLGFVFSGNILLGIAFVRKFYAQVGLDLQSFDTYSRGVVGQTTFEPLDFSGAECWISGHCLSIWGFIGSYGIVLLLVLIALSTYSIKGKPLTLNETLFGVALVLLPLMFFVVDFTGGPGLLSSWIKSRFLEPVYYYLVVLSWLAIAKQQKYRKLLLLLSGFWFIPLIVLRIIPQISVNLFWLVKQFTH